MEQVEWNMIVVLLFPAHFHSLTSYIFGVPIALPCQERTSHTCSLPHCVQFSFSFIMSPPFKVFLLTLLAAFCHGQVPSPSESAWPTQSFKTAPSARAPVLDITKSGASLAPGYLMMTQIPVTDEVANSSFIMTDTGDLVWYSNPGTYSNLVVQSLDSQPVLSCWNGTSINEQGYGFISILDTTYTEIYRVCPDIIALTPGNTTFPCYADIHESYITDRGSILVTVYDIAPADLTFVNGSKNGWVYDNLFYEVDIKTNRTLFRWSALESIPLASTKAVLGNFGFGNGSLTSPFDWFHINSVQSVGSNYLINARHTWSSYFLSSNGRIHWQIQVRLSQFGHTWSILLII